MILQKLCQVELRFVLQLIECQYSGFGKEDPFSSVFEKSLQIFAKYLSLCEEELGEVPLPHCQERGRLSLYKYDRRKFVNSQQSALPAVENCKKGLKNGGFLPRVF